MNEVRKRFFINGEPSQGADEHGQYLEEADKMLAFLREMKKRQGLDQAKRVINHHDGTKITAISSIGFDEVWIDIPYFPPVPDPEVREDEEEEEDKGDYLWIGIRPVQPINSEPASLDGAYSVCGLLIEPDGVHTLLGDAGYVETNQWMRTESGSPMSDPGSFNFAELQSYRTDENSLSFARIMPVGFEPLAVGYQTGQYIGGVRFSSGGVIGYSVVQNAYSMDSGDPFTVDGTLLPIDPKAPMTSGRYPDGQLGTPPNGDAWWGDPHWHNVFLLDPDPSIGAEGGNQLREQDQQIRAVVAETIDRLYGNKIRVKAGQYTLKVCMYGACRQNEGIPIDVEIEVRVGKTGRKTTATTVEDVTITLQEPVAPTVFKTTASIQWWSERVRAVLPYGVDTGFEAMNGPNPHGPMWWQGGLLIDVKGRAVSEEPALVPSVEIGLGVPMFVPDVWPLEDDACSAPIWYPYMLSSFYPGTVPIGDTLEEQAYHFARTFYRAIWYSGEQGWGFSDIDYSVYNLAPLIASIIAYATSSGRENLNGTKIIASGYPADLGTRPDPVITILEMSSTSSTEWGALIAGGQVYNGIYHHMRAVF